MKKQKINKSDDEKKLLETTQKNLSVEKWMEKDWDLRAEKDVLFYIKPIPGQTEKEFWEGGYESCDTKIIGVNTPTYDIIFQNKNPKKMRVLEIGCGIGRVLIPMSKIVGEVIGIDVSKKMVEFSQKYIKNISNCKILQNNGRDLKMFSDNYFDFCYSIIVFHHIPDKTVVENYIKEVSRILKSGSIFRFHIGLNKNNNSRKKPNTWQGSQFTLSEIDGLAKNHKFEILERTDLGKQYWLTFSSIK